MTVERKRVSPEGPFDHFYDLARANGWYVHVERWTDEDGRVLLKVRAGKGAREIDAPSVLDVTQLAASVRGMDEQIMREAA